MLCVAMMFALKVNAEGMNAQVAKVEFQKMDADGNGFVTNDEMQKYQEQQFKELDIDENGVLDTQELKRDQTDVFVKGDKN